MNYRRKGRYIVGTISQLKESNHIWYAGIGIDFYCGPERRSTDVS